MCMWGMCGGCDNCRIRILTPAKSLNLVGKAMLSSRVGWKLCALISIHYITDVSRFYMR